MRFLAMLAAVFCALTATAQDFQLRSDAGKQTGPFLFREGESVQIGTNTANLVNIRSQENRILDQMQAIRIPEINFRQADLRDVVAFLSDASIEHAPERKGVSMILRLDEQPLPAANTSSPFFKTPTNGVTTTRAHVPTVTFSALDITLKEALDIVCDITGYKYWMRGGIIMITHRDAPEGPIVVRKYDVLPSSAHRLIDLGSKMRQDGFLTMESNNKQNDKDGDILKSFFSEMGVPWPTGSYIKYVRGISKFVVGNTEENLAIFEDVLSTLHIQPYQIEIEVTFLACDRQLISDLGPDGATSATLTNLWANGQAGFLAAPRVVTGNGQQAKIKAHTEFIYPTRLAVNSPSGVTNTNDTATAFMIEPHDYVMREVGIILEVLPEVSPSSNLINILLSLEYIETPTWKKYNGTFIDTDGKAHQVQIPQPQFHTYNERSNVLITNGKRILIGGGIPSSDSQKLIYMLLTARKVGTDGEPLP